MNIEDIFRNTVHTMSVLDSSKARSNPGTVSASLQQKGSPCADTGTAGVGNPLDCEERFYNAASQILEDEPGLFTHKDCNELGAHIQRWVETARNNWEPRS